MPSHKWPHTADILKLMDTCHQAMQTTFFHMSKTAQENRPLQGLVPSLPYGQGQGLGQDLASKWQKDHPFHLPDAKYHCVPLLQFPWLSLGPFL